MSFKNDYIVLAPPDFSILVRPCILRLRLMVNGNQEDWGLVALLQAMIKNPVLLRNTSLGQFVLICNVCKVWVKQNRIQSFAYNLIMRALRIFLNKKRSK